MNTCARLESTSRRGRVHTSRDTAQHLISAGKEHWLEKREALTEMKGKGSMETYFINVDGEKAGSVVSDSSLYLYNTTGAANRRWKPIEGLDERTNRLVDWNVEELLKLMQLVVANRSSARRSNSKKDNTPKRSSSDLDLMDNPFDEVVEIIALPDFCIASSIDPEEVQIEEVVIEELHALVSEIAQLYNQNPFHVSEEWRYCQAASLRSCVRQSIHPLLPRNLTMPVTSL